VNNVKWTQYEIDAIKRYYPKGGWQAVAPHAPLRSKDAITRMACDLGVKLEYRTAATGKFRLTFHTREQEKQSRLMQGWRYAVKPAQLRAVA
jgi:hypothetical protein